LEQAQKQSLSDLVTSSFPSPPHKEIHENKFLLSFPRQKLELFLFKANQKKLELFLFKANHKI
jgi:hypothetical protein